MLHGPTVLNDFNRIWKSTWNPLRSENLISRRTRSGWRICEKDVGSMVGFGGKYFLHTKLNNNRIRKLRIKPNRKNTLMSWREAEDASETEKLWHGLFSLTTAKSRWTFFSFEKTNEAGEIHSRMALQPNRCERFLFVECLRPLDATTHCRWQSIYIWM